jgi:hypothetical protein
MNGRNAPRARTAPARRGRVTHALAIAVGAFLLAWGISLLAAPSAFGGAGDAVSGEGSGEGSTIPAAAAAGEENRRVVFVAGTRSHGYGAHEHNAGSLLLSRLLADGLDGVEVDVHHDGWPEDHSFFEGADAIVIFANGGGGHPALPHLDFLGGLMDDGVGLVLLHYAVEVPTEDAGEEFLDWVGGYFETHWSVNPHWVMEAMEMPDHPITRGVEPYSIDDEWYYHMRFRDGMAGVHPIITALPPASSLERDDGPHSGNPHVREAVLEREEPQHLAWAAERPGGGRGFGFTGAHWHWNWGHPMQRRVVLNAIAWAAGIDVPEGGVPVGHVTMADLVANQDYDRPENFNAARWEGLMEEWAREFGHHEHHQHH